MKVTKQQALEYLAGFQQALQAERRAVAGECRSKGETILAAHCEVNPRSIYGVLSVEVPRAMELVRYYGPEEVDLGADNEREESGDGTDDCT